MHSRRALSAARARALIAEHGDARAAARALQAEFAFTDRRTAPRVVARVMREDAGETVRGPGRPRREVTLRDGDRVELVTVAAAEAVGSATYTVSITTAEARLVGDDRDDLVIVANKER